MKNPSQSVGGALPKTEINALKVSAFLDMEHHVCGLRSMSQIMGDLLDRSLKDQDTGAGVGSMRVYLSADQVELLAFAWNDVISRAADVERAFFAAAHMGAAK